MNQDPGWRRVRGMLPRALIPGGLSRIVRQGGTTDPGPGSTRPDGPLTSVELQRLIYLSFLFAFVAILVVLVIIDPGGSSSMSVTTSLGVTGAVAIAVYAAIAIMRGRGRPVTTPAEAVGKYRTQMFTLIALAESVAMIGFVFVFLTGSLTPYLVGLALAVPGLYLAAPNRASIDRFQESIGGSVDVLAALTGRQDGQSRQRTDI